ncbi:hypothetical protein GJQ55_10155 [Venatoribacter cucullus]|uniref:Uncharacterized protein n=1 Tax=Venatoribacter cucullus TaxID=2661630 RepID=A0A9X7UZ34_9GAMM|nr:hypothetical protein [Venatoribacter cucullus]QQD24805.1 hypothetical protein GJQ55_10155 [Venatoribacter cucullus]
MTSVLSVLVVAVIIGVLLWLALVDRGRRGGRLSAEATRLGLHYRPYASLSERLREAHFMLLDCGQFRHFRHLLEGSLTNGRYLNLFDYSLITAHGVSTQTLLLLPCQLPDCERFCIGRHAWLDEDGFSETLQHPLQPLRKDQRPPRLHQWQLLSSEPAQLWNILQPELCDWLLAHPHLHIEWSAGILLLCRPGHLLEPEQLEAALDHAQSLIRLLQRQAGLPAGHD